MVIVMIKKSTPKKAIFPPGKKAGGKENCSMDFQIAGEFIIQIDSQSDRMYRFNHTFRSKRKERHLHKK
jgi:hypothetical protein